MSRIPAPYGLSPEKARQYGNVYKGGKAADGSSSDSIRASPRFTTKRAPQTANSNSRSGLQGPAGNGGGGHNSKVGGGIKAKEEVGTLRKELGKVVGISLNDVDTADVDKLRQAAAAAIKMEQRLKEVEQERANELRELQTMMSNLQRKEEELSKFVTAVQKRRQETDPYEKAQAKIADLERELQKALDQTLLDEEHRRLREESSHLHGLFTRIEEAVDKVQQANQAVFVGTEDEMAALQAAEEQKRAKTKEEIASLAAEMLAETEGLKTQLNSETNKRKKLHNQLVNLRGAIRVFCRVRPMLNADGDHIDGSISTEVDESIDTISVNGARANAHRPQDVKEKKYQFDRVFSMESSQEAIYDETSAVVTSVMDGYNVCIFAYGQTGSGKTYTMEGTESDRGVNYRTLKELFELAHLRRSQMVYKFEVSLVEVYNEEVRDLLAEYVPEVTWSTVGKTSSRPHLDLRVLPDGRVDIPGLITSEVDSLEAAWSILQRASSVRSSGATQSNAHSSRSHCLLRVVVHAYNKLNKDEMHAKLWLVDLAGSERVGKSEAKGERLKEAQFINKSLSSLGDCIYALSTKSNHIPYRNSKLTHMLADSLGGDSKTVMVVNVSPNTYDVGETTCSLNFASRVRGVEMGPAKRHVESNVSEVQKAKMQAADLKAQVEELQEVKLSQQKKIREALTEQDGLRDNLKKNEKARLKLEKKLAKLQEKLGAEVAVEEEPEEEEEEEYNDPMGVTFLAPTASPVYKATNPVLSNTPAEIRASSNLRPMEVGKSLKQRLSMGQSTEQVTVIATSAGVKVSQPKSDTFRARFADYRSKPDAAEEEEDALATAAEQAKMGKKKKQGRLRGWVRFF